MSEPRDTSVRAAAANGNAGLNAMQVLDYTNLILIKEIEKLRLAGYDVNGPLRAVPLRTAALSGPAMPPMLITSVSPRAVFRNANSNSASSRVNVANSGEISFCSFRFSPCFFSSYFIITCLSSVLRNTHYIQLYFAVFRTIMKWKTKTKI